MLMIMNSSGPITPIVNCNYYVYSYIEFKNFLGNITLFQPRLNFALKKRKIDLKIDCIGSF